MGWNVQGENFHRLEFQTDQALRCEAGSKCDYPWIIEYKLPSWKSCVNNWVQETRILRTWWGGI